MFNTFYTMMQQILCTKGYSNSFAGICSAVVILGGFVGAPVSGIIVDRTKKFEEVMKISFSLAILAGIGFAEFALHPNMHAFIVLFCILFGIFGLAGYPVGLELSAECTFPVEQTTSSGLIVLSGQIQGVIYIMMMSFLAEDATPADTVEIQNLAPNYKSRKFFWRSCET